MKILLITPTSWQVIGFRSKLIEQMQKNNHEVSVITFDSIHQDEIRVRGVGFYCTNDSNRSGNPLKVFSLKNRYYKIIKKINPDLVFTFMLKTNIFGVLATYKAGIKKIYSMVEGGGDVFINQSLKWRFIRYYIRYLYKKSLKHSRKVFFLNKDDQLEFISKKIIKEQQSEIVNGIGVDLHNFYFSPITHKNNFLMVARLLKNKGVFEYCECARIVKHAYPNAIFNYVGEEGDISVSDLAVYINSGAINYHGYSKDVRKFYLESSVFVLPSYREGLPVSVMEAEAMGRMIITTDTNGCRDTVIDGKNGFLVKVGDVESLVKKVLWCIENEHEVIKMGKNARHYAEQKYDHAKVNIQILEKIGL